jgi:flagellar assembly factor FliW
VKIQTTRFGELQIKKNDILSFSEGILGFEHLKKFFIVDPGNSTLILWLQSYDDGSVAFPIIEPRIFKPDYSVKLLPAEMNSLSMESMNDAKVYCILTIPSSNIMAMSANLKAPIIINSKNNFSRQIVLQDNKLPVCFEMYKKLKQYIVNYSSDDSKGKISGAHLSSDTSECIDEANELDDAQSPMVEAQSSSSIKEQSSSQINN